MFKNAEYLNPAQCDQIVISDEVAHKFHNIVLANEEQDSLTEDLLASMEHYDESLADALEYFVSVFDDDDEEQAHSFKEGFAIAANLLIWEAGRKGEVTSSIDEESITGFSCQFNFNRVKHDSYFLSRFGAMIENNLALFNSVQCWLRMKEDIADGDEEAIWLGVVCMHDVMVEQLFTDNLLRVYEKSLN